MDIEYKEVDGTSYHAGTCAEVVRVLESARASNQRLAIHYGDTETGEPWGDIETGYIGRSTGRIKIPLTIHNTRSMGGGGVLDHCIVRIETSKGKALLYQWRAPCKN